MPFRGVDPDGLVDLAAASLAATNRAPESVRPAFAVLERNGLPRAAAALAIASNRIDIWGRETADNLRWRSRIIAVGQNMQWNTGSLLRARFAAEAVFTRSSREDAYAMWATDRHRGEQRIEKAASDIAGWLAQSMTDWDVSNNDLHNIRRTLESLNGGEIDRVIQRLSAPQLERWIAEMGHSFNGFSRDEKRDVFALLAEHASGSSLGRVHDAILEAGGEEELADFGSAVRGMSSDETIVEFVATVTARDLTAQRFSALAPAVAVAGIEGDDAAAAAAAAIVNSDSALGALTVDSINHDDGTGFEGLVSLLVRGSNADRSAAFATFASLATNRDDTLGNLITDHWQRNNFGNKPVRHLEARLAEAIQSRAMGAATRMLEVDPAATIMELARNLDPTGTLTASFWHRMVADGQGAAIGDILRRLRGGDTVHLATFSIEGDDPTYRYPNAQNLAFTAATLNRGFTAAADEATGDIDAIVRIASIATAVLGFAAKGAELTTSLVGAGTDVGVAGQGAVVKDDIEVQLAALIDRVCGRLRPTELGQDPPAGLGGALHAWLNVYTALLPGA